MLNLSFVDVLQLSLYDLWSKLVGVLPGVIWAVVLLVLGLVISPLLGKAVKLIISAIKIDELLKKAGINEAVKDYIPNFSVAVFLGWLTKWFFFIVFFLGMANVLGWDNVSVFFNQVLLLIPKVFVAVFILVIGVVAGNAVATVVSGAISGSKAPVGNPAVLGKLAKWAIVAFAFLTALDQVEVLTFMSQILFAGIVLALALSFGLAGKDKAKEFIDEVSSR